MRLITVIVIIFLLKSCCQKKTVNRIDIYGKVKLIVLKDTKYEKVILYKKQNIISKIISENDKTIVHFKRNFCKSLDSMNLGVSYFDLILYDSLDNIEISFSSQSIVSSIRSKNTSSSKLIFDVKENTYFKDRKITVIW
jgi:hypothetical protein